MEDQEGEVYLDPWDHPDPQEPMAKEEVLDHRDPKVIHTITVDHQPLQDI